MAEEAERTSLPLLWHIPFSHFNEKVRWALDFKSIPHRRRCVGADYLISRELQPSGYLVGEAFSVADLTAAALLALLLQPAELQYPLAVTLPASLRQYRDDVARHPAAQWTLEMYRRHRGSSAEVRRAKTVAPSSSA